MGQTGRLLKGDLYMHARWVLPIYLGITPSYNAGRGHSPGLWTMWSTLSCLYSTPARRYSRNRVFLRLLQTSSRCWQILICERNIRETMFCGENEKLYRALSFSLLVLAQRTRQEIALTPS